MPMMTRTKSVAPLQLQRNIRFSPRTLMMDTRSSSHDPFWQLGKTTLQRNSVIRNADWYSRQRGASGRTLGIMQGSRNESNPNSPTCESFGLKPFGLKSPLWFQPSLTAVRLWEGSLLRVDCPVHLSASALYLSSFVGSCLRVCT